MKKTFINLPGKPLSQGAPANPKIVVALLGASILGGSSASAATLLTSSFTSVGLTSTQNIDVTGANVVDWGYYTQRTSFQSAPNPNNTKSASGIGTVTIVPGAITDSGGIAAPEPRLFTMTFSGGTAPASGTVALGAAFGNWAPNEDNAATFTFNNLGIGTHTVRLFLGHDSNTRIFDMDYSVNATDGNFNGNTASNSISSGELNSIYQLVFSTNDPGADLTLQLNSTNGGSGSGWIGGYVVETIPEPSAALLGGLGLLALLRRRRA